MLDQTNQSLPPLPEEWTANQLKSADHFQLRAQFGKYHEFAEAYEAEYEDKFNTYIMRESLYAKIFGKLEFLEEFDQITFDTRPSGGVLDDNEKLSSTMRMALYGAIGGLIVKLGGAYWDVKKARELGSLADDAAGTTKAAYFKGKGMKMPGKLKALAVLIGFGVFAFQIATTVEADNQIKAAIPQYHTWAVNIKNAVEDLDTAIGNINQAITDLMTATGVGSEPELITLLDNAIGEVGQFQALVNSARAMIADGLSDAQIATYTGLPEDYIQNLRLQ